MERIWHRYKPDKKKPPTKTYRPGKEGINQTKKDTKDSTEGAVENPQKRWKDLPQSKALWGKKDQKYILKTHLVFVKGRLQKQMYDDKSWVHKHQAKCYVWCKGNTSPSHHSMNTISTNFCSYMVMYLGITWSKPRPPSNCKSLA